MSNVSDVFLCAGPQASNDQSTVVEGTEMKEAFFEMEGSIRDAVKASDVLWAYVEAGPGVSAQEQWSDRTLYMIGVLKSHLSDLEQKFDAEDLT